MKKILFIDRDGAILTEPEAKQFDSIEKLEFRPGVITALSKIVREIDFELVMVTNQEGPGTPSSPAETFLLLHNLMLRILEGEGISFSAIYIDQSLKSDKSHYRKPGTASFSQFLARGVDLGSSYVIGNRLTDIELAENLGCNAIFISEGKNDAASLCTDDWNEIYLFLKKIPRRALVTRKTGETVVEAEINLDGTGKYCIDTGIGFFDHMLEQLSLHSSIDITLKAAGDLRVDEHHLVEDIAIVLGEAFSKALGSKKGTSRYGFTLPMDDALAQVAVDLGGRSWLDWKVKYRSERIGNMSTAMFYHFFRSFSDNAGCTIHIRASGQNDHHKTEAVFKAFARAMKTAVSKTENNIMPSTKGKL
jgi:imidazoleglycerol-phosphate dehydratase/histidinol-phosphatase